MRPLTTMKFNELQLHPNLQEGLDAMGFEETTPIQEQAIPELLKGRDLVGCAQTGTGKTAAFLIPVIERVLKSKNTGVKALVIAPTRELAIQIDQQLQGLGYFGGVSSIAIYGGKDGTSWAFEKSSLSEGGADVIICTPGRLIAHMGFDYVKFGELECLVLDEADRMLDMGFHDDIMKIVELTPKNRQTMLFSATMPPKIRKLADKLLNDPLNVEIAISKPSENIQQTAYVVYENQKERLLEKLMAGRNVKSCIIFCSTKLAVRSVNRMLQKKGWKSRAISSDLEQAEREEVLSGFRNNKYHFLVATDVLSRGIDIDDIEVVINYEVPRDAEDYVHRIGRTARAGASGEAITFVTPDGMRDFADIERLIEKQVNKPDVPEGLGEVPKFDPNMKRQGRSGGHGKGGQGGRGKHRPSGKGGKRPFRKNRKPKRSGDGGRSGSQ